MARKILKLKQSPAEFIKEARQTLRLTQEELASQIERPRYNIAKYETGKSVPPGDVILKIISLLESDIQL